MPKKRKRTEKQGPEPDARPSLPELPSELWQKIFKEAASSDTVEVMSRLRLINEKTAKELEFKIFSACVRDIFHKLSRDRKNEFNRWTEESMGTLDPAARAARMHGKIGVLKGQNAGDYMLQVFIYEMVERGGGLGDVWGKRWRRHCSHGQGKVEKGMAQACLAALRLSVSGGGADNQ